jgi:ATP/maltotriose-dependent transcriptional regulator MalT
MFSDWSANYPIKIYCKYNFTIPSKVRSLAMVRMPNVSMDDGSYVDSPKTHYTNTACIETANQKVTDRVPANAAQSNGNIAQKVLSKIQNGLNRKKDSHVMFKKKNKKEESSKELTNKSQSQPDIQFANFLYESLQEDAINNAICFLHAVNDLFTQLQLTKREQQVALKMLRGNSNAMISKDLYITEGTVKYHVHNIYGKSGVNSRKEFQALVKNSIKKK